MFIPLSDSDRVNLYRSSWRERCGFRVKLLWMQSSKPMGRADLELFVEDALRVAKHCGDDLLEELVDSYKNGQETILEPLYKRYVKYINYNGRVLGERV